MKKWKDDAEKKSKDEEEKKRKEVKKGKEEEQESERKKAELKEDLRKIKEARLLEQKRHAEQIDALEQGNGQDKFHCPISGCSKVVETKSACGATLKACHTCLKRIGSHAAFVSMMSICHRKKRIKNSLLEAFRNICGSNTMSKGRR